MIQWGSRLLTPAALFFLAAISAGIAGYASGGSDGASGFHDAGVEEVPAVKGVIQSVTVDAVTIATVDGNQTFRFAQSFTVETLRPTSLTSVRPGDWLNAGAVSHAQTLYALTGLVVIAESSFKPPDP